MAAMPSQREKVSVVARGGGAAGLKQMRKGTKSCLECRRRKIKCSYPEPSQEDPASTALADHGSASESGSSLVCNECKQHGRQCRVQGFVASETIPPAGEDSVNNDPRSGRPSARIYKRRRDINDLDPGEFTRQNRSRMDIQVNRMDSMVERLAREQDGPWQPNSTLQLFKSLGLPDIDGAGLAGRSEVSGLDDPGSASTQNPQLKPTTANTLLNSRIPAEDEARKTSPLLTQLFNNEMLAQRCISPAIITEKVQVLTFSDLTSDINAASDAEKLRSTISTEPYLLKVVEISTHWWVAWRDQTFALHEVFFNPKSHQVSGDDTSSESGTVSNGDSPGSTTSWPHKEIKPISLRDFVQAKLAANDAVSIGTALLCIAMSLRDLRAGVDDVELNISTAPAELTERIVLAVDTVLLSPSADPAYMKDSGLLLLYMMRAKIYAEANQLRKSWLSIRQAIEVARESGFTDALPFQQDGEVPLLDEAHVSSILHRQRWIGSILELDRLMSLVLGFPHAQDDKFSDHLALDVLRGNVIAATGDSNGCVPVDLRMRAFRRVVAVIAGRVNDRNSSNQPDDSRYNTTMCIQSTLDEAAAGMPTYWWDVDSHMNYTDPYVSYQHLMAQMWFWQVQAFLHLPFMLKPLPDGSGKLSEATQNSPDSSIDPYEPSRQLCRQACLGMLRIFYLLRSDPSLAVYICPCEDFQGVFCACILMVMVIFRLSHCPSSHGSPELVIDSVREDLDLIEQVKDIFRFRAKHLNGGIGKQGFKVLDELGGFLDDYLSGTEPQKRTVVLPYFGAIRLEMKSLSNAPLAESLALDGDTPYQDNNVIPRDMPGTEGASQGQPLGPPQTLLAKDCENFDDPSFQFPLPDTDADWDQFLFGDELNRTWDLSIPEWAFDNDASQLT
ncbi:uncharacterized protein PV06_10703 [Exophiala oligosperma]|uniref:Zn(2)-C6 fungal-type domain-containing protein n=1 Tax=Exophiala oligosperma TaxID=215243 RepID=A0A0D2DMW5_9EURO|nr:uncharacterized protein PV06_10703 [Exophiala oligosperma]KIW37074.1 hypothetical protein PV06_10703 [Exophiala oligosperma]